MKNILSITGLLCSLFFISSCGDFEEINTDPLAVSTEQVEVEFFINGAIGNAQQDPHISERIFVLYWLDAANMVRISGTLTQGWNSDGWNNDYFNRYVSRWLRDINSGVRVAEEKIAAGNIKEETNNLLQIARIWRAYLMSEMADNFGPIPIDGFQGENPEYSSVQEVYYYALSELADATSKLDETLTFFPDPELDPAYGYDYTKWKKYGNSLRMRLAMRLSEVDGARAQQEFEDAVATNLFISESGDDLKVQEAGGWNSYTNVMSREWSTQYMGAAYKNLAVGLGGVPTANQLPADKQGTIKEANYLGQLFDEHFTQLTNDPTAGYWLDGLPNSIDPRAYRTFPIPGNLDDPQYNTYPSWDNNHANSVRSLRDDDGEVLMDIDAAFTWNAFTGGDWGSKGAKNRLIYQGTYPRLADRFRGGENDGRIFFASWESYFLIAEAAIRGWNVPMDGKTAYETGIASSFEYFGVSEHLQDYLTSENYNFAGTSASWDHTTEPPSNVAMDFVNGYTGEAGTVDFTYAENTIYEGGAVKNDLLTKIITQKYISQTPWLALEAWNDHRRLGLPFFQNPAVENPLAFLPQLDANNVHTNRVDFFGQRLRYPASFRDNIPTGHSQAVDLLGGPDEVHTPLWWAKSN